MSLIRKSSNAVSPVIGLILLVALTVGLVSITTVVVFDVGESSIDTSTNSEVKLIEKEGYVEATVVEIQDSDFEFEFKPPRGSSKTLSEVGETKTLQKGSGKYSVLTKSEGGMSGVIVQSVLKNVYNESDTKALDITYKNSSDGSIIDSTTVKSEIISKIKTVNDGDVTYQLVNGTYVGQFDAEGYYQKEKKITISSEGATTKDVTLEPKGTSVSGTVSINPPLNNALVEARLSDGSVVSDRTDTNGNYKINKPVSNVDTISVYVNGDDTNEDGNDVYASAQDTTVDTSNINFEFTNTVHKTINGETVEVSYETTNTGTKTISNIHQLQVLNSDLSATYKIIDDIDASSTSSWNNNNGLNPIGSYNSNPFSGKINGQNHTISGLNINRSGSDDVGLLSYTDSATIKNITIDSPSIKGDVNTGGLIGISSDSTIKDVKFSNALVNSSAENTGGIIGRVTGSGNSELSNIRYSGKVNQSSGINRTGGIIGYNDDNGMYKELQFSGTIDSNGSRTGGLIGESFDGEIRRSYAHYEINSDNNDDIGGLIGYNQGEINRSYSVGDINDPSNNASGVSGTNLGTIKRVYTVSTISGGSNKGGLAGYNGDTGNLTDAYWSNDVADHTGENTGTVNQNQKLTRSEMKGSEAQSNMGRLDIGSPSGSIWTTVVSSDSDSTSDYYPILVSIDRKVQLEDGGVSS